MLIFLQVVLYAGLAIQLFRPVDPAINYPRHITRIGVLVERMWRGLKFFIAWVVILFILAIFGVDINS